MTSDAAARLEGLRSQLAKARALKEIIRSSPDQTRRDAAIIAYSRVLDQLIEDLISLDDMGLLAVCAKRLNAAIK